MDLKRWVASSDTPVLRTDAPTVHQAREITAVVGTRPLRQDHSYPHKRNARNFFESDGRFFATQPERNPSHEMARNQRNGGNGRNLQEGRKPLKTKANPPNRRDSR